MINNIKILVIKFIGLILFRGNLYFILKKIIVLIEMFSQDTSYGNKKIKEIYTRASKLNLLISPPPLLGINKVRIGEFGDGGYVMSEWSSKKIQFISIGIGGNASWDAHLAELGATGTQWDHTIATAPMDLSRHGVKFYKVGLGVENEHHKNYKIYTLEKIINTSKLQSDSYKILKIDIEGDEWDVLEKNKIKELSIFDQVLIEFHDLANSVNNKKRYDQHIKVLTELKVDFNLIHSHINNSSFYFEFKGIVVPNVLELSYLNKKHVIREVKIEKITQDFTSQPDWIDINYGSGLKF